MIRLGSIADDLTGATDLANNLVRAGMRVVQTFGFPVERSIPDVDAIVVALKSRTIPAPEAVAQSLQACRWLRAQGADQIYFKVCSTFDSSPKGNIGPVIEALMDELGCDFQSPRLLFLRIAAPSSTVICLSWHVALGNRDAEPPADAHDRRQPGALPAIATGPGQRAQSGPHRLQDCRRIFRSHSEQSPDLRRKASPSPLPTPSMTTI